MDQNHAIITLFEEAGALISGHFILSSGLHSERYVQCARMFVDAKRGEAVCRQLAAKLHDWLSQHPEHAFDVIVAPAMGGVVVGYEMGRQLGIPTMFCERVDGAFTLRRGFTLDPGQRVLIVEDVVTTGKSSMETAAAIEQYGAKPVAVASLIDRRGKNDVSLTLPLISLLTLEIPAYKPNELPERLTSIPAVKPGSRFLNKGAS